MTFMNAMTAGAAPMAFGWQEIATAMQGPVYTEPLLERSPEGNLLEGTQGLFADADPSEAVAAVNRQLVQQELAFASNGGLCQQGAKNRDAFIEEFNPVLSKRIDALATYIDGHRFGIPLFPASPDTMRERSQPGDRLFADSMLIHPALQGASLKGAVDCEIITPEAGATLAHALGGNIYTNLCALSAVRKEISQIKSAWFAFGAIVLFGAMSSLSEYLGRNAQILVEAVGHIGTVLGCCQFFASAYFNLKRASVMQKFHQPTDREDALAAIDHSAATHLDLLRGYAAAFPGVVSTDPARRMIESGLLAAPRDSEYGWH